MNSIFDLKTKKEELSSINENMSDLYYRQVQPLRNVIDNELTNDSRFGDSVLSLRWTLDSQTWWIPNRSYLRLRVKILGPDNQMLTDADDIAPGMGMAGLLFSKAQFKMADRTVVSITENLAECEAIYNRLNKSGDWLREIGQDTNFWESDREKRKQNIISDGIISSVVAICLSR